MTKLLKPYHKKKKKLHSLSAPKSGLNDFFSLKFLNIFTTLLLSLIAYLREKRRVNTAYYILDLNSTDH
jgi:hypothetical protein